VCVYTGMYVVFERFNSNWMPWISKQTECKRVASFSAVFNKHKINYTSFIKLAGQVSVSVVGGLAKLVAEVGKVGKVASYSAYLELNCRKPQWNGPKVGGENGVWEWLTNYRIRDLKSNEMRRRVPWIQLDIAWYILGIVLKHRKSQNNITSIKN